MLYKNNEIRNKYNISVNENKSFHHIPVITRHKIQNVRNYTCPKRISFPYKPICIQL